MFNVKQPLPIFKVTGNEHESTITTKGDVSKKPDKTTSSLLLAWLLIFSLALEVLPLPAFAQTSFAAPATLSTTAAKANDALAATNLTAFTNRSTSNSSTSSIITTTAKTANNGGGNNNNIKKPPFSVKAGFDNVKAYQNWFYGQRAVPAKTTPPNALSKALAQRKNVPNFVPAPSPKSAKAGTVSNQSANGNSFATLASAPASNPTPWTSIGSAPAQPLNPNSQPYSPLPYGNTTGRVSALAFDQTGNILYAGAASGGLWKSSDGGNNWANLTDNVSAVFSAPVSVGAIALDPTNPQIIYVGTGENNFNFDNYYSSGILKSSDGGNSWSLLGAATFGGQRTNGGLHISKLIIDPNSSASSRHILAATDNGLWLSTDGGNSWSQTLGAGASGHPAITDLIVDSTSSNPSTVYAAWGYPNGDSGNGIYKSTDGGQTFTLLNNAPNGVNYGRIAIAQAPSNLSQLYLSASNPNVASGSYGASLGVWSSSDKGNSWLQIAPATDGTCSLDLLGDGYCIYGHGWYAQFLAVDPTNAATLYVGGIDIYKSTNATTTTQNGASFTNLTNTYGGSTTTTIHPDQHALVFYGSATPRAFYVANDGGIYGSSDSGNTWNDDNGNNLSITEFYAGTTSSNFTTNPLVWGGSQGTGTQKYTGSTTWSQVLGGDGGFVVADPTNSNIAYAVYDNLNLYKTTDGGNTWSAANNGINPSSTDQILYLVPFVIDFNNPSRLLAGTDHLYESTDGANSWHLLSNQSLAANSNSQFPAISAIAIAPSNSNIIYVGTGDGKLWVTTSNGANWTDITNGTAGTSGRYVTSLGVDATNAQDVVVTFSGFASNTGNGSGTHVYHSTNGGTNWTDLSTSLPDSPVNSVVRYPQHPTTFAIGADDGFFLTQDGGQSWNQYQTGLPNVAVDQVFADTSLTTLLVATHGRGVYTLPTSVLSTLTPTLTINPTSLTFNTTFGGSNPASQVVTLTAANAVINWMSSVAYSSNSGTNTWLSLNTSAGSVNPNTPSPVTVNVSNGGLAAGTYTATVTFQDSANGTDSAVLTVTLVVAAQTGVLSVNPTNLNITAFAGATNPVTQTVTLTATNAPITWTSSISYGSGASNWLSLNPAGNTVSPSSPQTVVVSATTGSLAAGTYTATITFQDTANPSDKATVNVSFTVNPAPVLSANPNSLNFNAIYGSTNPPSQNVVLTTTNPAINYNENITYGSGASGWLTLSPTGGTVVSGTPTNVTVSAAISGLVAGTYTATITFQDTTYANDKAQVSVTLVVTPVISANPTNLTFNAVASGANPASQPITLSALGGNITWNSSISYGTGATNWLNLTPTNTTTVSGSPTILTVNATTGSLVSGTYTATITFQDVTYPNDKAQVNVTFIVAPAPVLSANPTGLTYAATATRGNPPSQVVTLTAANGSINWLSGIVYGTGASNWLTTSSVTNTVNVGSPQPVVVTATTGNITTAGTYTATLTFNDTINSNDKATVPVTFTVAAAPVLTVTPNALNFNAISTGTNPASQTVTLTATGGIITWTSNIVYSSNSLTNTWLSLNSSSGSVTPGTPSPLTVVITNTNLAPNTYTATVTFKDNLNPANTATLTVQYIVGNIPVLGATPPSLIFTGTASRPSPASQQITLTAANSSISWTESSITYSANSGSNNWLSLSSTSGLVSPGTPTPLIVTATTGSLISGTYTAMVTFKDNNFSSDKVTVPVTFTVGAAPVLTATPSSLSYSMILNRGNPASQSITLSATGGSINWNINSLTYGSGASGWLSLSSISGTVSPGSNQILTAAVNYTGSITGTFTATVTFVDAQNSNNTATVTVSLTVNPTPKLSVTPTNLSYSAISHQTLPVTQTVSLSNANGTITWTEAINYTGGGSTGWLKVSPTSNSITAGNPQTISIVPTTTQLSAGTYTANVTFSEVNYSSDQVTVAITYTVYPYLTVNPTSLTFSVYGGASLPITQNVTLTANYGAINWQPSISYNSGSGWLRLSSSSGAIGANGTQTVGIDPNTSNLTAGTYTANITFVAIGDPSGSNTILTVTYIVKPFLSFCSSSSLSFTAPYGGPTSSNQTLCLQGNYGQVNWHGAITYNSGSGWLAIAPTDSAVAGGSTQSVTVSIVTTNLAVGTYTASITFSDYNDGNDKISATITYTVSTPHFLTSPSSLSFSANVGWNDPSSQSVTLLSSGTIGWNASVSYTGGPQTGWLSLNAYNGTTYYNPASVISVHSAVSNLTPGTYTGIITINGNNGQTAQVNVTLIVSGYYYYIPVIANGGNGYTTYLTFQNTGTATANIQAHYYDSNGNYVPSSICSTVAVGGGCVAPNPFGSGGYGTGTITSDQPLAVILSEATPYGGSAYASIHAGSGSYFVLPHAYNNAYGSYITQYTIDNGSNSAASVTVQFYDSNGNYQSAATKTLNIAPHTSQTLDQSSNSNLPAGFVGWAQVNAPGSQINVQLLERNTSTHFLGLANAYPYDGGGYPTVFAPAIYRGGYGFTSSLVIANAYGSSANITINYYDSNGNSYYGSCTIPANGAISIYLGSTSGACIPSGGLPSGFVGSATISDQGSVPAVLVTNNGGTTSGGTAQSSLYLATPYGSGSRVGLPVVSNGGYGYTSGTNILNTSSQTINIQIQYYNYDGSTAMGLVTYIINPHAILQLYQGSEGLPPNFTGSAIIVQTSGPSNSVAATVNESGYSVYYSYTEPT